MKAFNITIVYKDGSSCNIISYKATSRTDAIVQIAEREKSHEVVSITIFDRII